MRRHVRRVAPSRCDGLEEAKLCRLPKVHVNVYVDNRAPNTEARAQRRSNGNGGLSFDIVVEQIEGQVAAKA